MKPIQLLLVFLCFCPLAVYAQTAEVGGAVQDPSGAVIPKASVEFRNQDTGVRRQTTTNDDGIYHIIGIDPGKYDATVQAGGFKTLTRENIVFQVGDKAQIDFKMEVGQEAQTITVNGSGLQVNTTDASVSTVIEQQFVENIPLNGRSFQDLISMTPGVVTQSPQSESLTGFNGDFSVNGERTESNYYMVDGVSANTTPGTSGGAPGAGTSGSLPGATALGTTQSLVSVDSLQEFQVQSSNYSAEYGRSPGAQFSFVTRSGSNHLHGSIFEYLRNNYFDANDWFNDYLGKPQPPLRQNDFGGTVGGPVVMPHLYNGKNRTFFFVSYEGLRLAQPQSATIRYVPDTYLRQQAATALQPMLNAFPIQSLNGIDYGTSASPNLAQFIEAYSLPSQIDFTSVRLDNQVNKRLHVFFRFSDTPTWTESRYLSKVEESIVNSQTYTFGATQQLTSKSTNEFRFGYSSATASENDYLDNFGGATPINLASAQGVGGFAQQIAGFVLIFPVAETLIQQANGGNFIRQWNVTDSVGTSRGRHELKAGVDYRRIDSPLTPWSGGEFLYSSASQLAQNAALESVILKQTSVTPVYNETAVFVNDNWRVNSRFAIQAGLRWELNPAPGEANGNNPYTLQGNISNPTSLTLAPKGTPLWKTTWFNFAPRLGTAWTVNNTQGKETVLRAGIGVFFDTGNEYGSSGFDGPGFLAESVLFGTPSPFTSTQINNVQINTQPTAPYGTIDAFYSHLQLPYSLQWNVALEQAAGTGRAVTVSYVAASGRRPLEEQEIYLHPLNSSFGYVYYWSNSSPSNYQSLQAKYEQQVSHGLTALASYSWSHSIDYGSNNQTLPYVRGNSDYDLRNSASAGVTYIIPGHVTSRPLEAVIGGWSADARLISRSAFPVNVLGNYLTDPATGNFYNSGVNLVSGQPLYIYGAACTAAYSNGKECPGGRAINPAAFALPSGSSSGDAPRNYARGFGATQLNIAARHDFPLFEGAKLQFRAEAFNLLNHPVFGYVDPVVTDPTFGQATETLNQSLGTLASQYQQGGPRSMQFALKIVF